MAQLPEDFDYDGIQDTEEQEISPEDAEALADAIAKEIVDAAIEELEA